MTSRTTSSGLPRVVRAFAETHGLAGRALAERGRAGPLVVGVSGGPDSVCLLHILASLQRKLGLSLHVAHLDHGLRGAEAEADAAYVARLTADMGVPATVEKRDVSAYRRGRKGLSLEMAAREVRYAFFADVMRAQGASTLALAHTAADQAETVLLHVLRGSGLGGVRGLRPVGPWPLRAGDASWKVVRPLLDVSHAQTESYCRAHALEPRTDASNRDLSFLRNRVRWDLLPVLRRYNPRIESALARLARAAGDDLDYIDARAAEAWPAVVRPDPRGLVVDAQGFAGLPAALQRHICIRALEEALDGPQGVTAAHVEAMLGALRKSVGRSLRLPDGLVLSVEHGGLVLGRQPESRSPFPPLAGEHPLRVPGATRLPGWRITAREMAREEVRSLPTGYQAALDRAAAGDSLVVRARRPGDRFQPLGMTEPKKLQDCMVDAKVPRLWRSRIPLVCSERGVLWVVGWRIGERVKVTEATRRVLLLEFEPVGA
ncbi:MAG: tRNA lysidine(34) synthetase TilS [Dehalococcoidia bacterium]|nr:tRNA lysidine(34) synthetase TilS [Dehalococcoidia bacterium]